MWYINTTIQQHTTHVYQQGAQHKDMNVCYVNLLLIRPEQLDTTNTYSKLTCLFT